MSSPHALLAQAKRLVRGDTAMLMLANLAAACVGIVTGVVAARALGPEARGDLAVVVFWPSLVATLVDLGIGDAVTLRCAQDPAGAARHHRIALTLASVAGALGLIGGIVLMPFVLREDQGDLLELANAALVYVPLSALAAVPMGTLLGLRRYGLVAAIRLGSALTYAVAMVAAVAAGVGTVTVLMALTVAARGLPLALGVFPARRALRAATPPIRTDEHWKGQAQDGVQLHGARLATVIGGAEDRALAAWLLPQTAIGYWQVASAVTVVMQFVSQAVSQHLYSTAAAGGDRLTETLLRSYVRALGLTAIVAAAGIPLLPLIVPMLYGEEFRPSVWPAAIVMVASVAAAGGATLQAAAKAIMRTRPCIAAEALGIGVMGAVAVGGADRWGVTGLAIAYLAGRVAVLVSLVVVAPRIFGSSVTGLVPLSKEFREALGTEVRGLST